MAGPAAISPTGGAALFCIRMSGLSSGSFFGLRVPTSISDVVPRSEMLQREHIQSLAAASACGIGLYRDRLRWEPLILRTMVRLSSESSDLTTTYARAVR